MNRPLAAACLALLAVAPLRAALNVVTTLPDFASIAEAVGGAHVKVTTLAKGTEDAHFVDPRPSFIRVLNRADVLLHGGADLEVGWLPPLLQSARNPAILPGQTGNVPMNAGIQLLEIPDGPISRSQGDVHPFGNPHFWLDPVNSRRMATHLAAVFAQLDAPRAADYREAAQRFAAELDRRLPAWTQTLQPLRGTRILTYHKSFNYFAHAFGLEIVGELEPRPGLEPSPTHIQSLISRTRTQHVRFILIEPFRPRRTADSVAAAIGATVLVVPEKVGSTPGATNTFSLFNELAGTLSSAFAGQPKPD